MKDLMTIEDIRLFCLQKPKTTEEFPFDQDTLVFKVLGKIFALCPLSQWERGAASITLKCDPEYALELRSEFDSILPGFHANKKHWNTMGECCCFFMMGSVRAWPGRCPGVAPAKHFALNKH